MLIIEYVQCCWVHCTQQHWTRITALLRLIIWRAAQMLIQVNAWNKQIPSFVGNLAPLLEILLTVCHSLISCYSLFYHSVSLSSRWHLYLFLFLSFFYSQHQQEYHFVRFGAKRPIYNILITYTGISGPFAYCDLVFDTQNNKKLDQQRQER